MANKVELKTLVEKMNLKNLTPDVDLSDKDVEIPDINRPCTDHWLCRIYISGEDDR